MADRMNFVLIWIVFCMGHVAMAADTNYMRTTITNHLSEIRNHFVNVSRKDATKQFIYEEFKRFGLETEYNNFTYGNPSKNLQGTFVNVVGVLKGTRFGTAEDKVIGIGAHYDTVTTSKGVDDNGAGVAAMLEAARQLTGAMVSRKNTIVFVSFDLEEYGLIGSEEFIRTWVNPWLVKNYGAAATSVKPHGVIVLDTVMEYNTTALSQAVPDETVMKTFFPDAYNSIHGDNFRGDFLVLIYRSPTPDADLASKFESSWGMSGRPQFELESLPIPFSDVSAIVSQSPELADLLRSDHLSFWNDNIPSIFISDSANFRGDMKVCYHAMCDDLETMLTDDNLAFLAKTADVITQTVSQLSEPIPHDPSGAEMKQLSRHLMTLVCSIFILNRFC